MGKTPRQELEEQIQRYNITHFLSEFVLGDLNLKLPSNQKIELCDGLVVLDDLVIAFQMKERVAQTTDLVWERKWFDNKVKKIATRQMRDTVRHLAQFAGTSVPNIAGRNVPIPSDIESRTILYVSVYKNQIVRKDADRFDRTHIDGKEIFVHIFEVTEWTDMISCLVTPSEISSYLQYRERVLQRPFNRRLSEHALIGAFVHNEETFPREHCRHFYTSALKGAPDLDMMIAREMGQRIYKHDPQIVPSEDGHTSNDYYPLLAQLAKMHRTELRSFMQYFGESFQAMDDGFVPRRLHIAGSPRAFVFMAVSKDKAHERLAFLRNITTGAKYTLKASIGIGVCFTRSHEEILVDWTMVEFPWTHDANLENMLATNNPFGPSSVRLIPRYP